MEDIIKMNIDIMFPGYKIDSRYCFKVSRDADILIDDVISTRNMAQDVKRKIKQRAGRYGYYIAAKQIVFRMRGGVGDYSFDRGIERVFVMNKLALRNFSEMRVLQTAKFSAELVGFYDTACKMYFALLARVFERRVNAFNARVFDKIHCRRKIIERVATNIPQRIQRAYKNERYRNIREDLRKIIRGKNESIRSVSDYNAVKSDKIGISHSLRNL